MVQLSAFLALSLCMQVPHAASRDYELVRYGNEARNFFVMPSTAAYRAIDIKYLRRANSIAAIGIRDGQAYLSISDLSHFSTRFIPIDKDLVFRSKLFADKGKLSFLARSNMKLFQYCYEPEEDAVEAVEVENGDGAAEFELSHFGSKSKTIQKLLKDGQLNARYLDTRQDSSSIGYPDLSAMYDFWPVLIGSPLLAEVASTADLENIAVANDELNIVRRIKGKYKTFSVAQLLSTTRLVSKYPYFFGLSCEVDSTGCSFGFYEDDDVAVKTRTVRVRFTTDGLAVTSFKSGRFVPELRL